VFESGGFVWIGFVWIEIDLRGLRRFRLD
jgi:hypothetical protein